MSEPQYGRNYQEAQDTRTDRYIEILASEYEKQPGKVLEYCEDNDPGVIRAIFGALSEAEEAGSDTADCRALASSLYRKGCLEMAAHKFNRDGLAEEDYLL